MDNEKYNQIIESAWKEYSDSHFIPGNPNGKLLSDQLFSVIPMAHNRESFREEARTNPKFAKKWGLKIEESELSFNERCEIQINQLDGMYSSAKDVFIKSSINEVKLEMMNRNNIPTKLIKVTYNNETIEIYE